MRRALGIGAVALLATACGLRPWTPSVSVAFWAEDVPASRDTTLPSSKELAEKWELAPDHPWARWSKNTLVSSPDALGPTAPMPDVRKLDVIAKAESAAVRLAQAGLPKDTMFVVDLRGAASCAFAARLSREAKEPVAPVLTFANWPANDAVVPAEETLAGLIAFTPRLPAASEGDAVPVFLLDSWRLAYRFDDPGPGAGVYDNRYMIMPGDLPDAATLKERGITRVVYVVEDLDDAEVEEDDLVASFRSWQAAGVALHMLDLDFLQRIVPPPPPSALDWPHTLAPVTYWSRSRWTLVDDPLFYARARGGFGMAYGRPVFVPGPHGGGGFRGSAG